MSDDPIADRRQRAREHAWDHYLPAVPGVAAGVEAAIEVATQVKITNDIVLAAKPVVPWLTEKDLLTRAFRAAGFEVVE